MTAGFVIAAAQSSSAKGDLDENVRRHCELAVRASKHDADFIVFPELSLSGYEPSLAEDRAITSENDLLSPLRDLADDLQMTIVAGCPIRSALSKPYIGAFILSPNQVCAYRKRFLHPGEEEHFVASNDTVVCICKERQVAIAICADINNPLHAESASDRNATIYAAGVAMTPGGISEAETNMSSYAKKHQMATIMANYASETGGFKMAGRSGMWGENGELVVQAPDNGEFLVLAEQSNNDWYGKIVPA